MEGQVEGKPVIQKVVSHMDYLNISDNNETHIPLQPADQKSNFIHCTLPDQTKNIIKKFYADQIVSVYDLCTDELEKEGFIIKFEINPGGSNKYPHIYHKSGKLNMIPVSAIKKTVVCV